jgi:uncharacterized membrane protein YfhO
MDIGADTYSSYWPYYAFYSQYVKELEYGFWSFNFGLGGNILTAHPLLIDPFNSILFLFDKENLDYGLIIVTVIKMYTVLFFTYKFLEKFQLSKFSLIIASISYTFSGYFIIWGQHYHFATMFALFTIVIYFVECWIQNSRYKKLVIAISIMSVHSPYFLYMIFLFLAIYVPLRYCFDHGFKLKTLSIFLIKTLGILILGMAIGAVLFIPEVYTMLNNPRIGASLYPKIQIASSVEYITILSKIISNNLLGIHYFNGYGNFYEAPQLFIGLLILFTVPRLFFQDSRNKFFVFTGIIIVIAIFIPNIVNPLFNGFSDYTYRWTFCLFPIFALALAKSITKIEEDKNSNRLNFQYWIVFGQIASLLIFFYLFREKLNINIQNLSEIKLSYLLVAFSAISYLLILHVKWTNDKGNFNRLFKGLLICVVLIEFIGNSYISVVMRSTISSEQKKELAYFDSTNSALEYINENDQSFFRVYKTFSKIDLNDALFQDFYGEKLYNSLNNKYLLEFGQIINVRSKDSMHYMVGYDDKYSLYNFLSFKYMLSKQKNDYFGYELMNQIGDVYIYKSKYVLPLAFAYDSYISDEEFRSLNLEQKINNLYYNFVSDRKVNFENNKVNMSSIKPIELDFENFFIEGLEVIEENLPQKIEISSNSYDPMMIFSFKKITSEPVQLQFDATSEINANGKIYYSVNGQFNEENSIPFLLEQGEKNYYFEINTTNLDQIRIDLTDNIGLYSLKNVNLYNRDSESLIGQINTLRDNKLEVTDFSNNKIVGNIEREKNGMLFYSIPYDKGWKAKLNGKPVRVEKVNYGFVGIEVPEGKHEVELYYQQEYLIHGLIVSIVALFIFAFLLVLNKVKIKQNSKRSKV